MFRCLNQLVARVGRCRRGRWGRGLSVAMGVVALGGPSWAAEPDLGEVVARLPMGVDMVLAMDDGARLRGELGEMPLMLTLSVLPGPSRIMNAWSGLAAEMGMTDAEAFDLLLGRRVVILGAGLRPDDESGPRWALLSEIDPETERRLRADLGAVPRRIVQGQPVMEFEHGAFLLATSSGRLRCVPGGVFDNTPASTLLLLAPAEDRALFEQLLPLLQCRTPERTLGQLDGGRAVEAMVARDAVFLYREAAAGGEAGRYIAANIGIREGTWEIDASMAPARAWMPSLPVGAMEAWSPKLLESLPPDPALVVVGTRAAVGEARELALPYGASMMPDPESAELSPLLGDRSIFAVWLDPDAGVDAEPEVLFASESPDLGRLMDRADGYLTGRTTTEHGTSARRQQTLASEPLSPAAVRSVAVPGSSSSRLHWAFVPEDCVGSGTAGAQGAPGAAQRGWWVVHFDPTGSAGAASGDKSDAQPGDTPAVTDGAACEPGSLLSGLALPPRAYLHVGRAMPQRWAARAAARFEGSGAGAAGDQTPPILLTSAIVLPQIRRCSWAVWYDDRAGSLEAQVAVDLRAGVQRAK